MQDSVDSLEEAMNEGLRLLDEAMREGSRDMGESMLKGMEEMNRALRESIEEMQHAEMIAERTLFLGGEVEMTVGREVEKIHDAEAMLEKAKALEQGSIADYNRFAVECSQNADSASKKLFEDLVAAEEGHFDQFDRQAQFVQRFGERIAGQPVELLLLPCRNRRRHRRPAPRPGGWRSP